MPAAAQISVLDPVELVGSAAEAHHETGLHHAQQRQGDDQALLGHARYQVLPTASVEAKVDDAVPLEVSITITSSPSIGLDKGLEVARASLAQGYEVVPHLAAKDGQRPGPAGNGGAVGGVRHHRGVRAGR